MIIVFDMDDTLYPEIEFVKSALFSVAEFLGEVMKTEYGPIHQELIEILQQSGRGEVFNIFLKRHQIYSKKLVTRCVSVYRRTKPNINLNASVKSLLTSLSSHSLYLLSDGNKSVQQNKVEALNLEPYFKKIFLSHRYGLRHSKPSSHCLELIAKQEHVELKDLIYVGDDPNKDFVALNKAGGTTIRVLTGRFARFEAEPGFDGKFSIPTINELPIILKKLERYP